MFKLMLLFQLIAFYMKNIIDFRLTESGFDTLRLILIALTVFLRIALMPMYLQAYLNMAYNRVEEQKKEAGRITNIDLQKKVILIF